MPFAPFFELFPEIGQQETRIITALPGSNLGVPPGEYQFVEMFCDELGCDCRRVFFSVFSSVQKELVAVIAWGWEDRDFYSRWLGMPDPEFAKEMQGPVLNLGSPQTKYASAVLELAKKFLLSDRAYVERIKRHYAMFRGKIDQGHVRKEWGQSPLKERKNKWKRLKKKFRTG